MNTLKVYDSGFCSVILILPFIVSFNLILLCANVSAIYIQVHAQLSIIALEDNYFVMLYITVRLHSITVPYTFKSSYI